MLIPVVKLLERKLKINQTWPLEWLSCWCKAIGRLVKSPKKKQGRTQSSEDAASRPCGDQPVVLAWARLMSSHRESSVIPRARGRDSPAGHTPAGNNMRCAILEYLLISSQVLRAGARRTHGMWASGQTPGHEDKDAIHGQRLPWPAGLATLGLERNCRIRAFGTQWQRRLLQERR